MFNSANVFERIGFASLEDLNSNEWKQIYELLNSYQEELCSYSVHSDDYIWPVRPLQNQTRPWEYPYAFSNIKKMSGRISSNKPIIADLGSGFTFFPYALARTLEMNVICIDNDDVPGRLYKKAKPLMDVGQGSLDFRQGDLELIPLESNSVDIAYSISVLEHLSNLEPVLMEINRILKDGGYFILTFDIDIQGNFDISPENWRLLRQMLDYHFVPIYPEVSVHPQDMLTNINHPLIPTRQSTLIKDFFREIFLLNKRYVVAKIWGPKGYYITSFGGCFMKGNK